MKLKIKNRIFLAPMEEVNDVAFRLLCKKAGAGLTYTGMIHPQSKQEVDLDDKPVLQLFCTSTKGIKECMKKYDKQVSGWDFNLGCPAKTARKHGFGSYLKDLDIIESILKEMRANTKKPLFVKLRKSKITFKILKIAEKYCDVVCIHPRTQGQGYGGEADLNYALEFKKKSKIPVIYSGDVKNLEEAKERLKDFDYVMMGRAAIGVPSVFGGERVGFEDYLKLAKKFDLPFRQLKYQAMQFTKGLNKAKETRSEIFKVKTLKGLIEFVESD
jgi:tRNA-dihydrouridine synthase B